MEAFWNTEYGQNLLSVEQSEIDRLLSSPDQTFLEDLFDEEELLQQCSNKNSKLVTFLSRPHNLTKLVSYITRPWQQHIEQIVHDLKQREASQKDTPTSGSTDANPNSKTRPPRSPLSKNGTTEITAIAEGDESFELDNGDNGDDANNNKNTNNTPQTSNTTTTTQKESAVTTNNDNKTNAIANASAILSQIIDKNIPGDKDDAKTSTNSTDEAKAGDDDVKTEPFDKEEQLKFSEDDDDDNAERQDGDKSKESKIGTPPTLKKKGSIVDMLLDGPEHDDSTEYDGKLKDGPLKDEQDADPELPDLKVTNDETDTHAQVQTASISDDDQAPTDNNNKIAIADIPPPPPLPQQTPPPSRLEEFKSDVGVERVKLKYPYLASEIINCQIPQILDPILDPSNPFLDMLFDFIEQAPPLNAVLTNYWRSCIVGLVRRNANVVLAYIKSRKDLLSSLVQHIRDQSVMELVIALGWDPAIEELKELDEVADWMYAQQLVPQLIATLAPERTPDEHSAASYTLVDIVAKTSRSTNLVLFHNLASSHQIDALMHHMFAGNRSSLLESLSVLLALLHHYPNVSAEKQQFGDDEEYQPPTNPLAGNDGTNGDDEAPPPPPPPLPPADDMVQNINPLAALNMTAIVSHVDDNDDGDGGTNETPTDKPEKDGDETANTDTNTNENENDTTATTITVTFDSNIPAVVRAVCHRLSDFKTLLETQPEKALQLPFVRLSPPLGPVRHKVVDMIVALMRTPCDTVSDKLRDLGLIRTCIDLFFAYPWNNLLHGSVEHIIQMVVSGDCDILKQALFEDCDFLNRILEARRLSAQHQLEKKFRLGYMGHITRVSNTIVEFAKRNPQLEAYMQANAAWVKFIGDDLKLENEQLNTQLGGHRPTALADDDGDDFTLFSLNDMSRHDADVAEQVLGAGYGDEEIDHDSDSDSEEEDGYDEDAGRTQTAHASQKSDDAGREPEKSAAEYELPNDAFSRFTRSVDAMGGGPIVEADQNAAPSGSAGGGGGDAGAGAGDAGAGGDDFDTWFTNNDDEDRWNALDGDKNDGAKKPNETQPNAAEEEEDKKAPQQQAIANTSADDAFADWGDDDPFANDNKNNNAASKADANANALNAGQDDNEDGLEIPDGLTPSPQAPDKERLSNGYYENENETDHKDETSAAPKNANQNENENISQTATATTPSDKLNSQPNKQNNETEPQKVLG